jgi:uncharacterized membrane protein
VPGAAGTHVGKVNKHDQVVGVYRAATADPDVVTTGLWGFLWGRGRYTRIDVPGAMFTSLTDLNHHGVIRVTTCDPPTGNATFALDINDDGQIVGFSFEVADPFATLRGFLPLGPGAGSPPSAAPAGT